MLRVPAFMREAYSMRFVCWPAGRAEDSNRKSFAISSYTETTRREECCGKQHSSMVASHKKRPYSCYLHILFLGGDNALPHEEAVVLKELVVLLGLLLALVHQEADNPLLQNIAKLSEER